MSNGPGGTIPETKNPPGRWDTARQLLDLAARFVSSGLFFMIVGSIFLYFAHQTMGAAHAAMSFVLVVVGVAILLYGTGTQGMGEFDSGENAEKVARYKVALAGGAGVLAFCAAAGIIAFARDMKEAFQVEQKYIRFQINGTSYDSSTDIGLYVPDVRINGVPVPAVRKGDHIEVFAPYIMNAESKLFEIRAELRLVATQGKLRDRADGVFMVELTKAGEIVEIVDQKRSKGERYATDAGYDFPRYTLKKKLDLNKVILVSGEAPL